MTYKNLTDTINSIIIKLNNIENYLEKQNNKTKKYIYLERKLKILQEKIPDKKILTKSVDNKDLSDVILNILDGLSEIDSSIEGGLDLVVENFNTTGSPEKQPIAIKFLIAIFPVYLKWKTLISNYHEQTYKAVDLAIERATGDPNDLDGHIAGGKEKIIQKKFAPKPTDLIPTFITYVFVFISVGEYKTFLSGLLNRL